MTGYSIGSGQRVAFIPSRWESVAGFAHGLCINGKVPAALELDSMEGGIHAHRHGSTAESDREASNFIGRVLRSRILIIGSAAETWQWNTSSTLVVRSWHSVCVCTSTPYSVQGTIHGT